MAAHPIARMTAAAVLCFGVLATATGIGSAVPVFLGMAGPLAMAAGTWLILERVHAREPGRVSGALVKLFGVKMILVGAYVASVLVLLPRGKPVFAVSFVSHYILLHVIEALHLRRLSSVANVEAHRAGVN